VQLSKSIVNVIKPGKIIRTGVAGHLKIHTGTKNARSNAIRKKFGHARNYGQHYERVKLREKSVRYVVKKMPTPIMMIMTSLWR
jgi:hypothetical protein